MPGGVAASADAARWRPGATRGAAVHLGLAVLSVLRMLYDVWAAAMRTLFAVSVCSLVCACATGKDLGDGGDDGAGAEATSTAAGGTGVGTGGPTGSSSAGAAAAGGMGGSGASAGGESSSSSTSVSASSAATSSSGGCTPVDLIVGGGFESGPSGGDWVESSTQFGTPICDVATCGMGGGTGPYAGTFWAWFGGSNVGPEQATVSQAVVIPVGMATLDFQLEIPSCEDPAYASDSFQVSIDGNVVFQTSNQDPSCGLVGYQAESVDLSAYANGASHTITFTGTTDDVFEVTNFMLDAVQLNVCR